MFLRIIAGAPVSFGMLWSLKWLIEQFQGGPDLVQMYLPSGGRGLAKWLPNMCNHFVSVKERCKPIFNRLLGLPIGNISSMDGRQINLEVQQQNLVLFEMF